MLGLLEELLNGGPLWVFAPLGTLIILPILIEARALIVGEGPRTAGLMAGALALAGWAAVAAAPAYSADRQQRFVLQSVTVAPLDETYWSVVDDGAPLPDRMQQLAAWKLGKIPYSQRRTWFAPAPAVAGLKPPAIGAVTSTPERGGRRATFQVRTNGALGFTLVAPDKSQILTAGVAGFVRPIDSTTNSGRYSIGCFGRSCDGVTMEFTTAAKGPIDFTLTAFVPSLPPSARALVAARPLNSRPQYLPDATVTISRVRL
jgi:hypothetical protein